MMAHVNEQVREHFGYIVAVEIYGFIASKNDDVRL